MSKNYYEMLNIPNTSSDEEIRKAYHKLALKWHPDRHTNDTPENKKIAEEKFKEINKIYEVLSDPVKRKNYDQFGEEIFNQNNGANDFQFHDANDVFNNFFHSFNGFGGIPKYTKSRKFAKNVNFNADGLNGNMPFYFSDMNYGENNYFPDIQPSKKDDPIHFDVFVTLEELYNGTQKKMKISRKNNTKRNAKTETEYMTIDVLSGWKDGTKITFEEKGDINPNSKPADIIFIIKQKCHDKFIRDGNDLIYTLDISLDEALNGFEKNMKNLDGENITIKLTEGISESNFTYKINNKGMPIRKDGKVNGRGDLLIKFNVHLKN